jgi:hypothetical protein
MPYRPILGGLEAFMAYSRDRSDVPGIETDDLMSPGYVWFDTAYWNVPDPGNGWLVVYRPGEGDGHITGAMRDAVKQHYASLAAKAKAAKRAEHVRFMAKIEKRKTAPADEHERMQRERAWDDLHNDGASGYNPYRVGDDPTYAG